MHEFDHEMQVVCRGERHACDLICLKEMVQIGQGEVLAGGACAVCLRRGKREGVLFFGDFEGALLRQEDAMARCARRIGGVECVDAEGNGEM